MRLKSAIPLIFLVLVTWAGAGGISYAVVELTAGGSQGEQGIAGPAGPAGPPGSTAAPVSSGSSACEQAGAAVIEGFSTPGLSEFQPRGLVGVMSLACQ